MNAHGGRENGRTADLEEELVSLFTQNDSSDATRPRSGNVLARHGRRLK
jgi:hypothetical protein